MAKIPSLKRILSEQFADLKWMPNFLSLLNPFIEEVNRALNKQLTVSENMDGVVQTLRINHVYPVKFAWQSKRPPTDAWITRVRTVSGATTAFTDAIFLDWQIAADGSFQVNGIPGLPTSQPYYVRIIALAES